MATVACAIYAAILGGVDVLEAVLVCVVFFFADLFAFMPGDGHEDDIGQGEDADNHDAGNH